VRISNPCSSSTKALNSSITVFDPKAQFTPDLDRRKTSFSDPVLNRSWGHGVSIGNFLLGNEIAITTSLLGKFLLALSPSLSSLLKWLFCCHHLIRQDYAAIKRKITHYYEQIFSSNKLCKNNLQA
jgi:hypothetical protein